VESTQAARSVDNLYSYSPRPPPSR